MFRGGRRCLRAGVFGGGERGAGLGRLDRRLLRLGLLDRRLVRLYLLAGEDVRAAGQQVGRDVDHIVLGGRIIGGLVRIGLRGALSLGHRTKSLTAGPETEHRVHRAVAVPDVKRVGDGARYEFLGLAHRVEWIRAAGEKGGDGG